MLSDWCYNNQLTINVDKCYVMSFFRTRMSLHYDYTLTGRAIQRTYEFCDLGVIFNTKLSFNRHIEVITSRASSRLGMIKRWSKEFSDPYVTKALYVSLVRSILEYACPVWNPYYNNHIGRIESIQKQFLLFALNSLNWSDRLHPPPYANRLLLLNMLTLQQRRTMASIIFLFKLLCGEVDCPYLLSHLSIRCPSRPSRNYCFLYLKPNICNYLKYEPLTNIIVKFNDMYMISGFDNVNNSSFQLIDFTLSPIQVKANLLNFFKRSLQN